jgi:hypothetical protein
VGRVDSTKFTISSLPAYVRKFDVDTNLLYSLHQWQLIIHNLFVWSYRKLMDNFLFGNQKYVLGPPSYVDGH